MPHRFRNKTPLQHERDLLIGALEHLPLALFAKDYREGIGKFILWNSTAESLWGLKNSQVIGKSDFDFFPKEQAEYFKQKDLECIHSGKLLFVEEEAVDSPIVGQRWVRTWKVPLKVGADRGDYLLGISLDITRQREVERALELERAQRIESFRLASLGEMAVGIVHEINNPLAIIQGVLFRMNKRLTAQNAVTPEWEKDFGILNKTVERIAKIVRGLRTTAHGRTGESFDIFAIEEVVLDTLEFCKERFRPASVELRCGDIPKGTVYGNPSQIAQVLVNLLNNAYDAVHLTPNPWVELSFVKSGGFLKIQVTDSGPGIPESIAEKIMDPFFTTKAVGKGTGLGLSISGDIAAKHGGKLELNKNSRNTCFVLSLPLAQPASQRALG